MAEYLGLAVDIGAYFLFSHLERRLKNNVYEIRDHVPTFHSHAALKRRLKVVNNEGTNEIAYARLEGRVEPCGQPLHTDRDGETGVFKITENFRVRRDRSPDDHRFFSDAIMAYL